MSKKSKAKRLGGATRVCRRILLTGWLVVAATPVVWGGDGETLTPLVLGVEAGSGLQAVPAPAAVAVGEAASEGLRTNLAEEMIESMPLPEGAVGETLDPVPQVGELERLVAVALSQHPEAYGAAQDVNREAGLRYQSTRKPNPWIGYLGSEIGNDGRGGQQGMYVSQEWVTAGKLKLADGVGGWRTRAAEERRELTRLRLSQRVGDQYWRMVSARRRVELLSQLEKLLQEAVKVNESLFKAAEVDKGTVLQAKLESGQVAALKRQAEADLRARTAALAGTLGGDFDTVASAGSDPWPEPRSFMAGGAGAESGGVIDGGMLIGQPYLSSPELAESYALIQAARCDVRLAETQIISNIESMASVQQDLATNSTIAGLQLGMALPIHDRKTGLVRAARAELAKTEAEYARRQRDLETRWAQAVGEYQTAWELVRSIETELLDLAQQRYDLAVKAQRQGEISYIELLTAQRSLLSIREAVLSAREQAALAGIRLENLVVRDLQ